MKSQDLPKTGWAQVYSRRMSNGGPGGGDMTATSSLRMRAQRARLFSSQRPHRPRGRRKTGVVLETGTQLSRAMKTTPRRWMSWSGQRPRWKGRDVSCHPPLRHISDRGTTAKSLRSYCLSEAVLGSCSFCRGFVLFAAGAFLATGLLVLLACCFCLWSFLPGTCLVDAGFICAVLG